MQTISRPSRTASGSRSIVAAAGLQAVWNAHGAASFAFEELRSEADEQAYAHDKALKERGACWMKERDAAPM